MVVLVKLVNLVSYIYSFWFSGHPRWRVSRATTLTQRSNSYGRNFKHHDNLMRYDWAGMVLVLNNVETSSIKLTSISKARLRLEHAYHLAPLDGILFEFSQVLSSAAFVNTSSAWTCICKIGLFIFLGEPLWETLSDYFWSHKTQIIPGHFLKDSLSQYNLEGEGWQFPLKEGKVLFPKRKLLSKHSILIYFLLYWR